MLDEGIVNIESVNSFKNKLDKYILNKTASAIVSGHLSRDSEFQTPCRSAITIITK
jgi:hypothetical protein